MATKLYRPKYEGSWALVIGINDYRYVSPLEYARNDAEAVCDLLTHRFNFPEANVILLTDEEATRDKIVVALDALESNVADDDRVLVFFAGHGHTQTGHRREVGFLVPVDGNPEKTSSLIRWEELTGRTELIPAKHVFFVMDACYGGLAITRSLSAGSVRFLRDMLQRFSRQVVTAGKADEAVADSGGPIPDHSVFSGHFIQALEGSAAAADGTITANGVMSYVYEKVAKDQHSRQTPHYGFIDGDGDFIFDAPILSQAVEPPEETGSDVLVEVPVTAVGALGLDYQELVGLVKQYISDDRSRIELHDLATQEIRKVLSLTSGDAFPVDGVEVTAQEIADRLTRYESILKDLQAIAILLSHWGTAQHIPIIRKAITRIAEQQEPASGTVAWIALHSYPATLLLYSGGIGAIAGGNYDNLSALLLSPVQWSEASRGQGEAVLRLGGAWGKLSDVSKRLPGHERQFVPMSEYLFTRLQPGLDDLLFLGKGYETVFDEFEVLLALIVADLHNQNYGRVWGPLGRFAWKYRGSLGDANPFDNLIQEAERQLVDWPPLKAGFFGASSERFLEVASWYRERLNKLGWH